MGLYVESITKYTKSLIAKGEATSMIENKETVYNCILLSMSNGSPVWGFMVVTTYYWLTRNLVFLDKLFCKLIVVFNFKFEMLHVPNWIKFNSSPNYILQIAHL